MTHVPRVVARNLAQRNWRRETGWALFLTPRRLRLFSRVVAFRIERDVPPRLFPVGPLVTSRRRQLK